MDLRPFYPSGPAPLTPDASGGPRLPAIAPTSDLHLDLILRQRLLPAGYPAHGLGQIEELALQLARIQNTADLHFDLLALDAPQLVVFAADHGLVDEGICTMAPSMTEQQVLELVRGEAPASALAGLHGFDLTVVDAGLAAPVRVPAGSRPKAPLQTRKIGYGTRNTMLSAAMSPAQAVSALHAGMDVVRHLPGNVLALGDVGVCNTASAALLLSRLCGVPLADACGQDPSLDETQNRLRLEKLFVAASRHRKATATLDVLATMGGFDIAMMAGAMLQAASERRVVLVDGFAGGAAALVARQLVPAVMDYLVFSHRSADPGHRLLLIHLQVRPLLDLELRVSQGLGALLAWPLLQASQQLLEH